MLTSSLQVSIGVSTQAVTYTLSYPVTTYSVQYITTTAVSTQLASTLPAETTTESYPVTVVSSYPVVTTVVSTQVSLQPESRREIGADSSRTDRIVHDLLQSDTDGNHHSPRFVHMLQR